MSWEPGEFLLASPHGPMKVSGYVRGPLGIHQTKGPSPKGYRKARWALTHLDTGLRIINLTGDVKSIFPVATEILNAGDWSFTGPTGWKNVFPDAGAKVAAILAKYPKHSSIPNAVDVTPEKRERVSREIAEKRGSL